MSELYKAFKFLKLLGKFALEHHITSNYKRYRIDDDYWRITLVETKNSYLISITKTALFFGKNYKAFRYLYGRGSYLQWDGETVEVNVIYELRSAYPYEIKQVVETTNLTVPKSFNVRQILELLFSFW